MWICPVGGMSLSTKAGWPSSVEVFTWLATALQAQDEARLERLWALAGDRVALLERCVACFARRYPDARIVFSGGSGALIYDEGAEAPLALRLLESLGIPRTRITLEDRSRNTVENAVLSKAIAQPKPGERWLLVTSAHDLPRAVGVFRKAGFPVEAYPVDWRTRGAEDALRPFASVGDGLRRSDTAVREWVGLAVYWLTGQSSSLFPGPTEAGGCDGAADSCRR